MASTRSGRTVVSHQYSRAPLQWLGPLHPSDRRQVLYLRNPNGGLLRGDAQSISVQLEADAHVEIRTQSATRLHPGLSRQDIE
ncbi:MAG: urease accessory protein UreD, partial [Cyanobacteria bacterium J06555_12]